MLNLCKYFGNYFGFQSFHSIFAENFRVLGYMKEKIIEKATELFLKVGFKSITMDDIATKMGISKKTIYKYFANKEILVEETSMYVQQKISDQIDVVVAQDYNPIQENFEIKKIIQNILQIADTSPLYQLKKHYPEVHEKLMACQQEQCDHVFRQNIEKGIEQGFYRKNVDITSSVFFYYTMTFHINDTTISEKETQKLELALLEYHTRALATPKGVIELEKQLATLI